jgi:hypothetical protein
METYNELNNRISQVLTYGGDLNELKTQWTKELRKLDVFMEMFLETYGNRILGDKRNTPEWKLYSQKTESYSNYSRAIRSVDYFISKQKYANNGTQVVS